MQGFINTTAGLRPVLLDGIEEVTYTTNAGGLHHTGSLGIKYIPNSGTGTGNIFINIPAYDNLQYPIEKFWDWVNSVSAGQNKTYNQFLGSGVVIGAVVGTITTGAGVTPRTAYVIQVDDDLPIEDLCELVFDTDAAGGPNYTNILTNGGPTPAVFDHVFINSQQGYSPFGMIHSSQLFPSPNNAAIPNGTYAMLVGTPQVQEKGSTFDQSGDIYRVVINKGIIDSIQICPLQLQVSELKGWIRSIFDFEDQTPACGQTCAQVAICDGCDLSEAVWDLGNRVGPWYPVKYAFNNIPVPINGLPEDPAFDPCYQAHYGGNFLSAQQLIPVGATSYIKGFYDTEYVPMTNGNSITIAPGPEPIQVNIGALMSNGLAMYTTNSPVNSYVFEIDWGAQGYNDCEGNPITQAYFGADPLVPGCSTPPMGTFASFLNDNFAGTVSGYAEFPCITQAGGGGGEPS